MDQREKRILKEEKKEKRRRIVRYIDWILLIALIITVLMVRAEGYYMKPQTKVIEVCNGQVIPKVNIADIEYVTKEGIEDGRRTTGINLESKEES